MKLRRGWPLVLLVVLLVGIPLAELWLVIQIGRQIGPWPTVLILAGGALLGGWLVRHEGAKAWTALNQAYRTGRVPTGELADAALILVGGVLLLVPGFLTDVIGFAFLLRWTRPLARKLIAFFVARRMSRLGVPVARARMDRTNLIEGETDEPAAAGRARSGPRGRRSGGRHRGRDRGSALTGVVR